LGGSPRETPSAAVPTTRPPPPPPSPTSWPFSAGLKALVLPKV
jgi:hypothetical protein